MRVLADGSVLSWSHDSTLLHWSMNGRLQATFRGHNYGVKGTLELTDGSILSWSTNDKTLRRWVVDGTPLATFSGHTSMVEGALELEDGSILSWSNDNTLRRWAVDNVDNIFEGFSEPFTGELEVEDSDFWSDDDIPDPWAVDDTAMATFEGHKGTVKGALELTDGSILSWSSDKTLRRWAVDGTLLATFDGHTWPVNGALELADGSILSRSGDKTLRQWDMEGHVLGIVDESYRGDKVRIFAWAREQGFDPNEIWKAKDEPYLGMNRVAGREKTILVYNAQTGETLARFVGDADIICLAVTGDVIVAGDAAGRVMFLRYTG